MGRTNRHSLIRNTMGFRLGRFIIILVCPDSPAITIRRVIIIEVVLVRLVVLVMSLGKQKDEFVTELGGVIDLFLRLFSTMQFLLSFSVPYTIAYLFYDG